MDMKTKPATIDKRIAAETAKLIARTTKAGRIVDALYERIPNPAAVLDAVATATLAEWQDFAREAGLRGASPQTVAMVLWRLTEDQVGGR